MGIESINSEQNFNQQVLHSNTPVLVDFWAEWCGPCLSLATKLEEISIEFKEKVKFFKINVDRHPDIAAKYNVRSIPTLILFKQGKETKQVVGNQSKEEIISAISSSSSS